MVKKASTIRKKTTETRLQSKLSGNCSKCYGYGLHAFGDPSPMGPMDYYDGMPTKKCPECGKGGR